jgi:hypothetical protein
MAKQAHFKSLKRIALILCLALTGCATNMVKVAEVRTSLITWQKHYPVICGNAPLTDGCAMTAPYTLDDNRCVLTMIEDSSDWVIAHEVRHCFGYVHRED